MGLIRFTDALGREITFGSAPKRVVSLVPSDTFNIAALGCESAIVGRTDYCELPDSIKAVPSVGGTKNPRVADIAALSPDLVIANKEENTRGDLEALVQEHRIRVYVCFPKRVEEGLAHLARLARIFQVEGDAKVKALVQEGYAAVRSAEERRKLQMPLRTFCPIWMDPLMTVHGATFISDMLDLVGAQNVFADRERRFPLAADIGKAKPLPPDRTEGRDTRYPRVTLEEVTLRQPELVLLPDEPHPFTEADAAVFRGLAIPAAQRNAVVFTPGKDLCWYGAQSVQGIERLRASLDPFRIPN